MSFCPTHYPIVGYAVSSLTILGTVSSTSFSHKLSHQAFQSPGNQWGFSATSELPVPIPNTRSNLCFSSRYLPQPALSLTYLPHHAFITHTTQKPQMPTAARNTGSRGQSHMLSVHLKAKTNKQQQQNKQEKTINCGLKFQESGLDGEQKGINRTGARDRDHIPEFYGPG